MDTQCYDSRGNLAKIDQLKKLCVILLLCIWRLKSDYLYEIINSNLIDIKYLFLKFTLGH